MVNVNPAATQYDPANLNNERGRGSNQRITESTWLVRPFAGPNTDNYEGDVFWYMGQNKGDNTIEEQINTFINKSAVIEKDFAAHMIGRSMPFTITLSNYTDFVENLCNNTNEGIVYAGSSFPGTRKQVQTFSTDIIAANVYTWVFKTINKDGTVIETTATATYNTSHDHTMDLIVTAITANAGIDATLTGQALDVITVVAKAGYIIETTTAAVFTLGVTRPTVVAVDTDTSIITLTIDNATSPITKDSFGVLDVSDLAAAPNEGVGAQFNLLTGNSLIGTMYEQPHVKRISETDNIVYLEETLSQLPTDGDDAMVIGKTNFGSGGNRLANKFELKLEGDDHSGLNKNSMYFFEVQVLKAKKMRGNEGEVAELSCLAFYKRTGSGSTAGYKPFAHWKVPSRAGNL